MDAVFHVGMDFHKSGIHAVVLVGLQVEPDCKLSLPYDFSKLCKPFDHLLDRGPVIAAIDAGCMRLVMYSQVYTTWVSSWPVSWKICRWPVYGSPRKATINPRIG